METLKTLDIFEKLNCVILFDFFLQIRKFLKIIDPPHPKFLSNSYNSSSPLDFSLNLQIINITTPFHQKIKKILSLIFCLVLYFKVNLVINWPNSEIRERQYDEIWTKQNKGLSTI